MSSFCFN